MTSFDAKTPSFNDFDQSSSYTTYFSLFLPKFNRYNQTYHFIAGFAFWVLMSFAHHWHLFGYLGSGFWWMCAVLCTGMTLLSAYPIYKDFYKDIFRLGLAMTVGFIGITFSFTGWMPVGLILGGYGLLSLFRSVFGHMDDRKSEWNKAQYEIFLLQIALYAFSGVLNVYAYYPLIWSISSFLYLGYNRPEEYVGAGMVSASFISAYFAWLLSSAVVMFPFLMSQYGVHVFYHDALLTISAIGFGQYLKQQSSRSKDIFPAVKSRVDGVDKVKSQFKLKVGDLVLLTKDIHLLPGLKFKVIEADHAEGCTRQDEKSPQHITEGKTIGNAESDFEKIYSGRVFAKVLKAADKDVRIALDPGQGVMQYFVPGVIVFSLVAFLFWSSLGMYQQAVSALVNTLLIACPCTFTIALPLLEEKTKAYFKNEVGDKIKLYNIDRVLATKMDYLVIDRSHTLVNQGQGSGSVWQMTDSQKLSFKALVEASGAKKILILSGHGDKEAENQMETDVENLKNDLGVQIKIWMDTQFNAKSGSKEASENKGKVIRYIEEHSPCFGCKEKFKNFKENVFGDEKASAGGFFHWFKKKSSVMMVGDGHNDIDALKRASLSIHVGDDLGVLAQSNACANVEKIEDLTEDNLNKLKEILDRYREFAFYFRVAAMVFNLVAIALSSGGWYALFGQSMPCGLGCVAMAFFSFTLSVVANDFVFNDQLDFNKKSTNGRHSLLSSFTFKGIQDLACSMYHRAFSSDNENKKDKKQCCH